MSAGGARGEERYERATPWWPRGLQEVLAASRRGGRGQVERRCPPLSGVPGHRRPRRHRTPGRAGRPRWTSRVGSAGSSAGPAEEDAMQGRSENPAAGSFPQSCGWPGEGKTRRLQASQACWNMPGASALAGQVGLCEVEASLGYRVGSRPAGTIGRLCLKMTKTSQVAIYLWVHKAYVCI